LDGVIEHDGGYTYGAWTTPYRSPAGAAALFEAYEPNFDLLLGRRTYDIFSSFWPAAGDFPTANAINAATKYIVTHRPDSLEWGPVEGLGGDVAEAIRDLKSQMGPT
jgi:dihydrofolate reductase